MRKFLAAPALAWALSLTPLLAAAPTPTPAPRAFEGEIDYDLFYTSYEPVIHLRYMVKGSRVRMDWVDVDESENAWGKVRKVKESAFLDLADGKMWTEEKKKKLHFDAVATPDPVEVSKASVLNPKFASFLGEEDFGKSVKAYEATYHYSLAPQGAPPGQAPGKQDFQINLWTAGGAQELADPNGHGRKIKLEPNDDLRNGPFPLLLQLKRGPGAHPMMMGGQMVGDMHHNFICMYAVKVIRKSIRESEFSPKPQYAARDGAELFVDRDLFNQSVTLAPATPEGKK